MKLFCEIVLIQAFSLFWQTNAKLYLVLDRYTDVFSSWSLRGDYFYVSKLSEVWKVGGGIFMDLENGPIGGAEGIWIVVSDQHEPSMDFDRIPSSFVITYWSSAQLLESLYIRYVMKGTTAKISVKKNRYDEHPFELNGANTTMEDWIQVTVPLEGSASFIVEANVTSHLDYILLDKLVGTFRETTTVPTTRIPKSTTSIPFVNSGVRLTDSFNFLLFPFLFIIFRNHI